MNKLFSQGIIAWNLRTSTSVVMLNIQKFQYTSFWPYPEFVEFWKNELNAIHHKGGLQNDTTICT